MKSIWGTTLQAGGKWSGKLGRGQWVRFTAQEAGANMAMLLYHAAEISERYNMPDTLKAQYTAHLTTGHVLMSDNGRVLASIIEDTLGWHDPIGGVTTRDVTAAKYGDTSYQQLRNDRYGNGRDNLSVELVRNGLGVRDLVPAVNWFSKVYCDSAGRLHYETGHCPKGASVTLRLEMDVLMVLSNTPHPLDPRADFPSVPVSIEVLTAEAIDPATDVCVHHRAENLRAFENTWEYFKLLGQ